MYISLLYVYNLSLDEMNEHSVHRTHSAKDIIPNLSLNSTQYVLVLYWPISNANIPHAQETLNLGQSCIYINFPSRPS